MKSTANLRIEGLVRVYTGKLIEKFRVDISKMPELEEEGNALNYDFHTIDVSQIDPDVMDAMKRERNRLHAKRTRLRKKRLFEKMEQVIK